VTSDKQEYRIRNAATQKYYCFILAADAELRRSLLLVIRHSSLVVRHCREMKLEAYRIMEEMENSYWWFRARREIISGTLTRYLAPGSDILDFGCGTGGIATKLCELGYRVVAADNSEQALAACRRVGFQTIDLSNEWPARGSADCVLAGDVLEHIEDDVGLLVKLRDTLRPGGYLIATVPAYEFLWSGEDYVSNHVRRYTRSTLQRRICAAGYRTIWCSYFNTILFPVVLAAVLGKRIFRPRDMYRSDVSPLPDWQNETLYTLFAFERHLLRGLRFPIGASLITVAKALGQEPKT